MHIAKLHKYRCVEDLGATIVATFNSQSQWRRIEVGSSLRDMHGSPCLFFFVSSIEGTVKHLTRVPMGAPLPHIGAMAGYSSALSILVHLNQRLGTSLLTEAFILVYFDFLSLTGCVYLQVLRDLSALH